jgi:hypothetical protein
MGVYRVRSITKIASEDKAFLLAFLSRWPLSFQTKRACRTGPKPKCRDVRNWVAIGGRTDVPQTSSEVRN